MASLYSEMTACPLWRSSRQLAPLIYFNLFDPLLTETCWTVRQVALQKRMRIYMQIAVSSFSLRITIARIQFEIMHFDIAPTRFPDAYNCSRVHKRVTIIRGSFATTLRNKEGEEKPQKKDAGAY